MLPKTDLIRESLKDLCAANARLLQDLALVARDGEKELLEQLQVAEEKEKFHRLRARRAEKSCGSSRVESPGLGKSTRGRVKP